jgi:hypothetical protein
MSIAGWALGLGLLNALGNNNSDSTSGGATFSNLPNGGTNNTNNYQGLQGAALNSMDSLQLNQNTGAGLANLINSIVSKLSGTNSNGIGGFTPNSELFNNGASSFGDWTKTAGYQDLSNSGGWNMNLK